MNAPTQTYRPGFSLIETVIAIGVLAVLLTGFMIVFAPAAAGIRKALNSQDAARLVTTLEEELVTLRAGDKELLNDRFNKPADNNPTGFDKAFEFIRASSDTSSAEGSKGALLIYKYRASLTAVRADGSPEPVTVIGDQVPGVDYVVQNMMRRKGEDGSEFFADLPAIEGQVYMVRCTQLIMNDTKDALVQLDEKGQIENVDGSKPSTPDDYNHEVITFVADFFPCPGKADAYFKGDEFTKLFDTKSKPMFSRNLAVRR